MSLVTELKRVGFAVGGVGLALALVADADFWIFYSDTRLMDALREIGGALVAGAVVAMIVALFEDRREEERVEREESRAVQASTAAWRRSLELELVTTVFAEMEQLRSDRRFSATQPELVASTRSLHRLSVKTKNISQLLNGGERVGAVHEALCNWEKQAFELYPTEIAEIGGFSTVGDSGAFDALKYAVKRYVADEYPEDHEPGGESTTATLQ